MAEVTAPPKPWTRKMLCSMKNGADGCGARFKIGGPDVKYVKDSKAPFFALCPTCGAAVTVEHTDAHPVRRDVRVAAEQAAAA